MDNRLQTCHSGSLLMCKFVLLVLFSANGFNHSISISLHHVFICSFRYYQIVTSHICKLMFINTKAIYFTRFCVMGIAISERFLLFVSVQANVVSFSYYFLFLCCLRSLEVITRVMICKVKVK